MWVDEPGHAGTYSGHQLKGGIWYPLFICQGENCFAYMTVKRILSEQQTL